MEIQVGTNGSLHVFFVSRVLEMPEAASLYILVIMLTGLLFVPLWVRFSYRLGKHRTLCAGALFSCGASLIPALLPPQAFALGFAAYVVTGVNFAARELLMKSMMADVILEDTAASGEVRAGLFYSVLALTGKLAAALAVGITYWALAAIGFDTQAENAPATLLGFRWVMAGVPLLTGLAAAAIMWRFPLDAARQRELRAAISRREH